MSLKVWKVRDDLFIRGMFDKTPDKFDLLQELGVTTVITMLRKTDPDMFGLDFIDYYSFPLPDTDTVKEDAVLPAARVASEAIRQGGKVLIHCIAARDRAPFTAAVTLTMLEGISGAEAYQRVKAVKPNTLYNRAFVKYLAEIPAKGRRYDMESNV